MIIVGKCDRPTQWQLRLLHVVLMARLKQNSPARIQPQVDKVIALLSQTQVVMSETLQTTAGMARFAQNQIDLHIRLLANKPEELESTYAHEVGHLVAGYLFGEWGHGTQWRIVMHYLESDASRCHSMDVSEFKRPERKPNAEAA